MGEHLLARGWPLERPVAVRAEGRHVFSADGRRFLDAASAGLAATLGYGVPEIVDAIAEQARRLPAAHSLAFTTEVAEAYAEELTARLPGDLSRALFVTGGTEAIELALLMAYRIQAGRGEPGRMLFLARHLSYHGSSIATLGLGARSALRRPVEGLLPSVPHLPPPYPYRPEWHGRFPDAVSGISGLSDHLDAPLPDEALERGRSNPAEALEVAIEALGPERVCAFVAEPIVGASAGAVAPPAGYWPRVREICDRHGVLLVADEVMTGMGRCGAWSACERLGVVPDLMALGKGMAAAYQPLGAVVAREPHWQVLSAGPPGFPWGFTFAQHPVAIATGRAVLRHIDEHDLLAACRRVGERLQAGLLQALADHPHVGDIRGEGLLIGVELVADRDTREPFPRERDATGAVLAAARDASVLLYPARGGADGLAGDAFLVAPALTVTDAECDELVDSIVAALARLSGSP